MDPFYVELITVLRGCCHSFHRREKGDLEKPSHFPKVMRTAHVSEEVFQPVSEEKLTKKG